MFIDTHCHLNFPQFDNKREKIIAKNMRKQNKLMVVGVELQTSKLAYKLARKYPENIYAVIGFHPIYTKGGSIIGLKVPKFKAQDLKWLAQKISSKKVVGVGEIGLDFDYTCPNLKTRKQQESFFCAQIELALKKHKPVLIHSRDISISDKQFLKLEKRRALTRTLRIIKRYPDLRGVIHGYAGDFALAQKFIAHNFYIGIGSLITYPRKNKILQSVVKKIPLDKLLVESDAPYFPPQHKTPERYEPGEIQEIVLAIAKLKKISPAKVRKVTAENAKRLFKL